MTISSETSKADLDGNESVVKFAIPFAYVENSSAPPLKVYRRDDSTTPFGQQELTFTATDPPANENEYTVTDKTLSSDGNRVTAANVKVNSGDGLPLATENIVILRGEPYKQLVDVQAADGYPPGTAEKAYDIAVSMIQRLEEILGRAPKFRAASPTADKTIAEPSTGKYLVWDSSGNIANSSDLEAVPTEKKTVALSNGSTSKAVTFTETFTAAPVVIATIQNTSDSNPQFQPVVVTAVSSSGFTVKWNAALDTANYELNYLAVEATA